MLLDFILNFSLNFHLIVVELCSLVGELIFCIDLVLLMIIFCACYEMMFNLLVSMSLWLFSF